MRLRTLAVVLSTLTAGCTASVTYNNLDWLIPWYVDGYVDLTREQRKALEYRLEPLLEWHRDEELARYIELLDRIDADLADPVSPADVRAWIDEIEAAAARTETIMLDLALDFGASMNEAQVEEFIDSLWERQREYEEEFLSRSDEEYAEDSRNSLADLLERFTGRLLRPQRERLREASLALRRFDSPWLEDRGTWLTQLEGLLQRQPGWQAAVREAYFARPEKRSPRYRAVLSHNLAVVTEAVADILNGLSGAQRQRTAEEIERIRVRLRKLTRASASDLEEPRAWKRHASIAGRTSTTTC